MTLMTDGVEVHHGLEGVVAFESEHVTYTRGGRFAFRPGALTATDWPTATTPWIVLDRDGSGTIDSEPKY